MTAAILAAFLLAFARVSAFLLTAPLTGDKNMPMKVRLIAAVAFASIIAMTRGPIAPETMALALPMEVLTGALIGFAARLVLATAEAAGQLIGLPFALGFASTFDPSVGEAALVTRRLALTLAMLAFLAADGLRAGIRLMLLSPATKASTFNGIEAIIAWSGNVLAVALRFAAAAMVAGLVANIGIALAARAAPSLNIFSVVLAGMLVVGGVVLMTTAPTFARELERLAQESIQLMAQVAGH